MKFSIEQVIGDYKSFFLDLLERLSGLRINIAGMSISHICYRVENKREYKGIRDKLKIFSTAYAEHKFGGRLVSEFILKNSLDLGKGYRTSMIELLPPKATTSYSRGLENIGVVVGKKLPKFKEKYKYALTGEKNRSPSVKPLFITFENSKTVKFYDRPLQEIIEADGFKFFPIAGM